VILGILSDTHGFQQRTVLALDILEHLGAAAFVHCGDVGDESVLEPFVGRRTWFVWGNTDEVIPRRDDYARSLDLTPPPQIPLEFELAGRRLAVYHGHERAFVDLMQRLKRGDLDDFRARTAGLDYILYGHTHRAADLRAGTVRLINPGALERARPHTVATLDLRRDQLDFWQVDEHADPASPPRPFVLP